MQAIGVVPHGEVPDLTEVMYELLHKLTWATSLIQVNLAAAEAAEVLSSLLA